MYKKTASFFITCVLIFFSTSLHAQIYVSDSTSITIVSTLSSKKIVSVNTPKQLSTISGGVTITGPFYDTDNFLAGQLASAKNTAKPIKNKVPVRLKKIAEPIASCIVETKTPKKQPNLAIIFQSTSKATFISLYSANSRSSVPPSPPSAKALLQYPIVSDLVLSKYVVTTRDFKQHFYNKVEGMFFYSRPPPKV